MSKRRETPNPLFPHKERIFRAYQSHPEGFPIVPIFTEFADKNTYQVMPFSDRLDHLSRLGVMRELANFFIQEKLLKSHKYELWAKVKPEIIEKNTPAGEEIDHNLWVAMSGRRKGSYLAGVNIRLLTGSPTDSHQVGSIEYSWRMKDGLVDLVKGGAEFVLGPGWEIRPPYSEKYCPASSVMVDILKQFKTEVSQFQIDQPLAEKSKVLTYSEMAIRFGNRIQDYFLGSPDLEV